MMTEGRVTEKTVTGFVSRFAGRLRFPYLFALTALIFLLDVMIPDLIPFVDEILFGLATLLLGSLRKPAPPQAP